jgi:hypothetical protein
MYKKTAIVIVLSAIVLAGCGDEEARPPNNPTEDEVLEQNQEIGPRADESEGVTEESEVKPEEKDNEMIGDDEFDMPDTEGQIKEDTDLNK